MTRRRPTRLELHRLKRRYLGRDGPLISFSDLDPGDRKTISSEVFRTIKENPDRSPYEALAEVFDHWGVRCHHPQAQRLYEGKMRSIMPTARFKWYTCESCECYVINEDRFCSMPTRRPG